MKFKFLLPFLLFFLACKTLNQNPRLISYELVNGVEMIKKNGDFQEIVNNNGFTFQIMPAFFRNYGSLSESLVVRLNIDKKYSFLNFGNVTSKEFGELKNVNHEWLPISGKIDNLLFTASLASIEPLTRIEKIKRDTVIVTIGKTKLKFAPSSKVN